MIAALLVALACAGEKPVPDRDPALELAARRPYDEARALFDSGRYPEAAQAFEKFLAEYPGAEMADEARLRRAQSLSRAGKLAEAQAALSQMLEKYPTSPWKAQAAVELGLVQAKLGKKDDAAQTLRPMVEKMTDQEKKAAAPALAEAFAHSGDPGESARWAAQALDAAAPADQPRRLEEYLKRLEGSPAPAVAKLSAELDRKGAAWPWAAVKLSRIQMHLGDRTHALQTVEEVAALGGQGGAHDRARAMRDQLRSSGKVNPNLVGIVLPLTGKFKPFAESMLDAIALQLDLQGRGAVQVVIKDSRNEPEGAQQAVEELAREGALVIIGPIGLAEGTAAATRAQQLGVPIVSLARAEGLTQLGRYAFRNMVTSSAQARAVARYAAEKLGAKSYAVLAPESPTGEDLARFFWDAVAALGGEMRGFEHYPDRSTNFKKMVQRLVGRDNLAERTEFVEEEKRIAQEITDPYRRRKALAQLRNTAAPIIDFDVLFIPDFASTVRLVAPALAAEDIVTNGCDQKEVDIIKKTTKKEDLRTVQLMGWMGWDSQELVDERTGAARYVACSIFVDGFFARSDRPATKLFVEKFESTFHRPPQLLEAHAHDAAGIVRSIIESKHPATREDMREALATMPRPYEGATGDTRFGPDREPEKPLFWLWINRGNIVEFDPAGTPPVPPVPSAQAAVEQPKQP